VAWLWPAGWDDRRTVRLLWLALAVAAAATVAGLLLQGPYGAGLGLADALKTSVLRPVLHSRFGRVWLLRLVLLAVFALALTPRPRGRSAAAALAAAVGLGLIATVGLSSHASSGDLVAAALPVDVLHLGAAALWLGGLAVLLAGTLRADPDNAGVVDRFSRLAIGCVAVIVATGLFQTWRQVRVLDGFTNTTYGRTLLVKLGVFAVLLAVAALSRRAVQAHRLPSVRASALAEAALAAGVLVVTSLLVDAVPVRTALARPVAKEVVAGNVVVDLTVDPAKAGPVAIHLYTLSPTGEQLPVDAAAVRLSLPARGLGPLDVPMQRAGPAHFLAYGFPVPYAGTWRLEVSVTAGGWTSSAATTVKVR
jgi:copper transport protein